VAVTSPMPITTRLASTAEKITSPRRSVGGDAGPGDAALPIKIGFARGQKRALHLAGELTSRSRAARRAPSRARGDSVAHVR